MDCLFSENGKIEGHTLKAQLRAKALTFTGRPMSLLPRPLRIAHPWLHYTGLLLMVAGLPFSMLLMSLSQFFIGGNWILEGNYLEKWKRFRANPAAWALSGIFLMLLPGMLWTENWNDGLKLIRINLPFLIFPFVMASRPALPESHYFSLIRLFHVSVFLAVLTCGFIGVPRWLSGEYSDIRQISLFISHIRFSLLIVLSMLLLIWAWIEKPYRWLRFEKLLMVAVFCTNLVFLLVLQSLNALFIGLAVGLLWLMHHSWKRLGTTKTLIIACIPVLMAGIALFALRSVYKRYFEPAAVYASALPEKSSRGTPYRHELTVIENGHYIFSFLAEPELRQAWALRSKRSIDSTDAKGQPLLITAVRYLNSKGLRKDFDGLMQLSETDIRYIEQGIANYKYTGFWGIRQRVYQLLYELDYLRRDGSNASGHSLLMKLEFWKNSLILVSEHPLMGVGTGDIPDAFREQYRKTGSWLDAQWWMTSHNQYLYIAVGLGIPGLLLFLFLWFWPAFKMRRFSYTPFRLFFGIAMLAMITEDMFNTQAGVSLVAFFYTFFLFGVPFKKASTGSISEASMSSASGSPSAG